MEWILQLIRDIQMVVIGDRFINTLLVQVELPIIEFYERNDEQSWAVESFVMEELPAEPPKRELGIRYIQMMIPEDAADYNCITLDRETGLIGVGDFESNDREWWDLGMFDHSIIRRFGDVCRKAGITLLQNPN